MQLYEIWPDAILLRANYKAFQSGQVLHHPQVQSRYFVWCKSGSGWLVVNGRKFPFHAGDYFFLPWNHQITYHASIDNPFAVNCIHIIPQYPRNRKPLFWIYHASEAQNEEYCIRRDLPLSGYDSIMFGKLTRGNPLILLSEFIIARYMQVPREDAEMRYLAKLFIYEMTVQCSGKVRKWHMPHTEEFPTPLKNMLEAIEAMLEEPIPTSCLPFYSNKSMPTVNRLFRKYLRMTPRNYINQRKIYHGAYLLLSSEYNITEIAERLCFHDKFYFSKLFRKVMNTTPTAYRLENGTATVGIAQK